MSWLVQLHCGFKVDESGQYEKKKFLKSLLLQRIHGSGGVCRVHHRQKLLEVNISLTSEETCVSFVLCPESINVSIS